MRIKGCFFILLFLASIVTYSQKDHSLKKTSNFDNQYSLTSIQEVIDLKDRFDVAKSTNDYKFLFYYYALQCHLYNLERNLAVLDSAIYYAKLAKDNDLLANGYMSKGRLYYSENLTNDALDNYLIANEYLKNSKDPQLINSMKYHFASIKIYLGEYEEAIKLFQESAEYFNSQPDYKNQVRNLNSLYGLNVIYHRMGDMQNMERVNDQIIKEGIRLKSDFHINYGYISKGFIEHSKKNYEASIAITNEGLSYVLKNNDYEWIGSAYLNIGNNYWDLEKKEESLNYYKKVDSIFSSELVTSQLFRPMYERLIQHYKSKKDYKNELHYINQLLKLDSVNLSHFKYLSPKIHTEYNTKNLLLEKERLSEKLESTQSRFNILLIIGPILLIGLMIWIQYLKIQNRNFKRKYETLINLPVITEPDKKTVEINDALTLELIQKLEIFEKNNEFLQSNLTLSKLSAKLKTNSSYLSKTINEAKQKNFTTYLNDLRIKYIILLLKEQPKYRAYTIDGIAELAGYNTRQSFSKAFYENTGIRPSYFLKEIQKEKI